MIKIKNLHYWDLNNLFEWAMSQMLPEKNFKSVKVIIKFDKVYIYMYIYVKFIRKKVINNIFLKLMFNILKIYIIFPMIYPSYMKE